MVPRKRSSKNKRRSTTSINEKELGEGDSTNVNASEDIEANVEASAAVDDVTESQIPTEENSSTKLRRRKRRTSGVWNHYTDVFIEEKVGDMVVKKPMAACKYCPDVLCATKQARFVRTSQCYMDLNEEPKRKRLSLFLRDNVEVGQEQSKLDQYKNDLLLSWKEGNYFDILSWWKTHGANYPILARIARDVLAIPASIVVSKSAFSAGGRVVHKYRSRLDPELVKALICTKDWIRTGRKDPHNVTSLLDDLSDLSVNDDKVNQDGDASDVADHNVDDNDIVELEED